MKRQKGIFTLLAVILMIMAFLTASSAQEIEKININTASPVELTRLKRIGPILAERIVEYREKHGPFDRPADIMKVKGIGPKTFELNRDRIIVE